MESYGGGSRCAFNWEFDINNMAEDVEFLLKGMLSISKGNIALIQFVLLLKSLKIRNEFMTLVLRVLNKEYVSEQENGEALNKIRDLKMEHMKLITNAHVDLNKRINGGSDELSINKGKRKIAEDDEINNIIILCVEKLQKELDKINQEASCELLKIAQKYNQIRQPIYEKRRDIIKDIPHFWSTAFLKHHVLGGLVCTEDDRNIFEFLREIEVQFSQDVKSGYTIIFNFDSNPYFQNTKLWKKYTFLEDDGRTKTTASSIQWAQGKGVDERSFFKWFSEVYKRDEIGEIIKDELWPDPLVCFHHEESVNDVEVKNYEDEVVKDTEDEEQND